ncbi:MAG: hypothetical protein QNJ13_08180 [Paracoccaceae bacterium]|nr:hypothetical protein [Paracoccaceae bacterium]
MLEIAWLRGRVVATEAGPMIAAVGVGRSLFRNTAGAENIEDGWAQIVLRPATGIDLEMMERGYGVPFVMHE